MAWLWLVWVAIALVAAAAEVASLEFVLVMFAGAALVSAVAAAAGLAFPAQVIVFAFASAGLLFLARPPLLRWSRSARGAVTGVAALVGRQAEVVGEVTATDGRVRLDGELWSARSHHREQVLPVGMHAYVIAIDGATAVVSEEPPAADAQPRPRT
jgi:membrane protein implicated in regulation of membrane protease activity